MDKTHVEELLGLEKSKVKEKDADITRLRREKTALQKIINAERKAKEKLIREVHKLKEGASKRKSSNDPMDKIRYDQMRSEIRQNEHQARLDMTAAANSNKHSVNGKARAHAMENLQPLLQTMALGGGCHGGGHKNGAWNAGGVINALRNDNGMAGPLPPPMNAPFQMNLQQQHAPPPVQMQQTYAQLRPPHQQYQHYPQSQSQGYQPVQLRQQTQPMNNQENFQTNNNQHRSQHFQNDNNNTQHHQHFQSNSQQSVTSSFQSNSQQSVTSSMLEHNNQAALHYQYQHDSHYEDEGEDSLY